MYKPSTEANECMQLFQPRRIIGNSDNCLEAEKRQCLLFKFVCPAESKSGHYNSDLEEQRTFIEKLMISMRIQRKFHNTLYYSVVPPKPRLTQQVVIIYKCPSQRIRPSPIS
jgi:hypothetical protein